MLNILIADDSEIFIEFLKKYLKKLNPEFKIYTAQDGFQAYRILQQEEINLAFLDNIMPEYSGVDLLKLSKEMKLNTKIVIISGFGSIKIAVDTIKNGALGFLEKPIMDFKEINNYIDKVLNRKNISTIEENVETRTLIGSNKDILNIKELIKKISYSPSTVFIFGESGTGKDIVAQMIHNHSKRKDKPYITVNCSAIPENLIESELFGYKKGAFTGANSDRKGLFEEADKGTLFLDEIGDMPLFTQAKVLRAIQNREIKPIGSNQTVKIDVRIIAATNKDIKEEIKKGNFREDLWYRLNVFTIKIPPLRERPEDIKILAYHFVKKFNKILNKHIKEIPEDTLNLLKNYTWPGNIRELENAIERMSVLETGNKLSKENLPAEILNHKHENLDNFSLENKKNYIFKLKFREAKKIVISEFERNYILNALDLHKGNISKAASFSGLDRSNFRKLMKKYDL